MRLFWGEGLKTFFSGMNNQIIRINSFLRGNIPVFWYIGYQQLIGILSLVFSTASLPILDYGLSPLSNALRLAVYAVPDDFRSGL